MNTFKDRIIQAAKLDVRLYEEVESDTSAMDQAVGIVILSSIAAGIGNIGRGGIIGIFSFTIVALAGWYIWALLTYFIGTRFLPETDTKANLGELLRTIGFSSSPGLIRVLGFIPMLGSIIFWGSALWMLAAMVVAVKTALDYRSTSRAVIVCLIGWIIQMVVVMLLLHLFR